MTLIEIMIVIVIMASIATAVSLAVMSQFEKSRLKDAQMGSCTILQAVGLYRAYHPNTCPSMEDLLEDGQIDSNMRSEDPWNQPYVIDCSGTDPDVYSNGKDGSTPIRCKEEKAE